MQVLQSLKQAGRINSVDSLKNNDSSLSFQVFKPKENSPSAYGDDKGKDDGQDRLMQMMDLKFEKFESIITQVATNMGQLKGEVDKLKYKMEGAKLL